MPSCGMRRRAFLAALGSVTIYPLAARAQQPVPIVGCLVNGSPQDTDFSVAPFQRGLGELGYVDGENVVIEYRWASGHNERLPALAAELVSLPVAVIAALNGSASALALKALTKSIPIVFQTGGDAAELGLLTNLNRPEANLTGVSGITNFLVAQQLDLLRQMFPRANSFALLTNPASPNAKRLVQLTQAAAKSTGRDLMLVTASNDEELEAAFAKLAERRPGGVVVPTNAFFQTERRRVVMLAAQYKIPAIYDTREFAEAGGLISCGGGADRFRQVGVYVGRILRGAKPADLPVVRPSKFELVINRKAAKALGLDLPPAVLSLADAVID
ncbi:MAG TPA: ABC transporter substrate-binding protein [Xanthobacteraceae bacterium]|nr:ABC transporter substrate-binding protein [Xanthobacteraceae bacterium]